MKPNQNNPFAIERAAMMFHALGDPARLNLLLHLRENELCVNDLAKLENAKVGSISARLKTLFQAHLVQRRRDAQHIYYSLADHHIAELLDNMLAHATEGIH